MRQSEGRYVTLRYVTLVIYYCLPLSNHVRCEWLLLYLITFSDTHWVGLLWTSDQPVA
jgi:hypothetical protein